MYRCLVLLSTYNGEKYLPELLDSVMAQKDVRIDVLARDDGSKDKTVEILKKYDRVQVYTGENLKPAKSFLDLILTADASYDYYALCDQDDVWKPEKVISAIEHIKDSNKPTLYSSAVEVVDRDLNFIRKSFTDNSFKDPLYDILTYGTPGCTFVFNKALMQKLKEYKPTTISMHDSCFCHLDDSVPDVVESEPVDESAVQCNGWLGHLGNSERGENINNRAHRECDPDDAVHRDDNVDIFCFSFLTKKPVYVYKGCASWPALSEAVSLLRLKYT